MGVVSFSDPLPRRTIEGTLIHRGHVGTIYQAFNGAYLGRSAPRTLRILPDGSVFSERDLQKIRHSEQGWKYATGILERFGAAPIDGDPAVWLAHWLPQLTRRVRHPGNHKYCWPLSAAARKMMPSSAPYPKLNPLQSCEFRQPKRLWAGGVGLQHWHELGCTNAFSVHRKGPCTRLSIVGCRAELGLSASSELHGKALLRSSHRSLAFRGRIDSRSVSLDRNRGICRQVHATLFGWTCFPQLPPYKSPSSRKTEYGP